MVMTDNLLEWTAEESISAIRERKTSVRDYISIILERARQASALNAFITLTEPEATKAAEALDGAIARGDALPPLAGLAIAVKDNINMRGFPSSAGTEALRRFPVHTTAPSLQKLLDAGAIVIGKTNMHELAFGITSTNLSPFAGPVLNPYDRGKIPGGSSGGTAAAIAARVVPCGLGTDTGASTRLPAALTGTVGMRPSVGNGGAERRYHDENAVVPLSRTRDTVGAMGRTVADVALLDSVITGTDRALAADLRGVRLGVPPFLWSVLDEGLERVVLRAKEKLAIAGVVFVEADMPLLGQMDDSISFPIVLHEPLEDFPAYLKASGIEKEVTFNDVVNAISSPDVKAVFESVRNDVLGDRYEDAMRIHRPALQRYYADYFKSHQVDALLFPTSVLPAIPIDLEKGSGTISVGGGEPISTLGTFLRNTSPGSVAGIPGLSLPAGLTENGLPVGLEIDGPVGSDGYLLSLGLAVEQVLGSVPPPKV